MGLQRHFPMVVALIDSVRSIHLCTLRKKGIVWMFIVAACGEAVRYSRALEMGRVGKQ